MKYDCGEELEDLSGPKIIIQENDAELRCCSLLYILQGHKDFLADLISEVK